MIYDKIIIGGGVVGLATALAVKSKYPDCRLAVLEKESNWALHQSGRNSGVIHAGIYYKPGSKKALLTRAGNESIYQFCQEHQIPFDRCGKLIIATTNEQVMGLKTLHDRAIANGLVANQLGADEALELEPHVNCVAALHIPSTGIVNYSVVAAKYVELLERQGVDLILDCKVKKIWNHPWGYTLGTSKDFYKTKFLISCAGLYSDRIAAKAGIKSKMKIVPFRGEYWHLKKEKSHLVKNLIYPIPNPNFPFLGVHMTRLIDGSIHAGPNAVLAFAREGYTWNNVNGYDLFETLTYPGFWKLAGKYMDEGLKEMYRSIYKSAFLKSIQNLIPEIQEDDLVRGVAGVRAQALRPNGDLINDFEILERKRAIFVLNAPSPAATASLEIGKQISARCAE
jgi:(S)-2-hydroxyglutarate dehydrogenase